MGCMRSTQQGEIQYQEDLEKERGSMLTCDICTELVSLPNRMFKNQNKCAHPICVDCMIKYIDAKLDSGMCRIKCPSLDCGHHLDPLSCRPIVPRLVFDRWCDLLCEAAVLKIDRCYCPYSECSVLILNECGGSRKECKCPMCKKSFCFSCRVAWHQEYSCIEVEKRSDWHDVGSRVLAQNKNWKRCPACYHCVELASGCSIVKCRCGTYFCYKCERIASKGYCCGGMAHRLLYTITVLLVLVISLVITIIYKKYSSKK
ncbi:E3 ubiquitin-protein ligase RSL1-like [Apium graveolens]|uniref:E3 ubiquitin-protein ligase RSL1-like n=1 Tax=Apium graveolens TaxID=4045 RepID=UPI003D7A0668